MWEQLEVIQVIKDMDQILIKKILIKIQIMNQLIIQIIHIVLLYLFLKE